MEEEQRKAVIEVKPLVVAPPQPTEPPKKPMTKKERKAKKEEDKRCRIQQEKDSHHAGILLKAEMQEYTQYMHATKRRRSVQRMIPELEQMKKEKSKPAESVTQMIVTGNISNKFLELLASPTANLTDIMKPSLLVQQPSPPHPVTGLVSNSDSRRGVTKEKEEESAAAVGT